MAPDYAETHKELPVTIRPGRKASDAAPTATKASPKAEAARKAKAGQAARRQRPLFNAYAGTTMN